MLQELLFFLVFEQWMATAKCDSGLFFDLKLKSKGIRDLCSGDTTPLARDFKGKRTLIGELPLFSHDRCHLIF
jgi:hypothetical protein